MAKNAAPRRAKLKAIIADPTPGPSVRPEPEVKFGDNALLPDDLRKELEDRYGEPPAPVRYLLAAASLKLLSERVGVLAIDRKRDSVTIKFTEQAAIEPERLARFVAQTRGTQFSPGGVLKFNLKSTQPEAIIDQINGLLRELSPETVAQTWLQAK